MRVLLLVLLFASPSFADAFSYSFTANVLSNCAFCSTPNPRGFDIQGGDTFNGTFRLDWLPNQSMLSGYLDTTVGGEVFSGVASFSRWDILGGYLVKLQAGFEDGTVFSLFLIPVDRSGCALYGDCSAFPTTFANWGTLLIRDHTLGHIDPIDASWDSERYVNATLTITHAPEPSTWILLGSGLVGIWAWKRRATTGHRM